MKDREAPLDTAVSLSLIPLDDRVDTLEKVSVVIPYYLFISTQILRMFYANVATSLNK